MPCARGDRSSSRRGGEDPFPSSIVQRERDLRLYPVQSQRGLNMHLIHIADPRRGFGGGGEKMFLSQSGVLCVFSARTQN
ncbi:hypothetical protein FKM82_017339 [Ascaphus truei]